MPELPEVETMCRGLHPVVGKKISRVRHPRCRCKPIAMRPALPILQRQLRGTIIERVRRLGKRVVLETGSHALIFEPRMTGLVCLDEPPDQDYVRLCLEVGEDRPRQIIFWDRRGLGTVQLIRRSDIEDCIVKNRLGPDALTIDLETLVRQLASTRQAIKVALMDQRRIAGIGNLYASEILFAARIHPAWPARELKRSQWQAMWTSMREILLSAIRLEGSTLSDGTYRNALNSPGKYQNHHRVYDRENQRCPRCHRGIIRRIVQAQRSSFYCPWCQRLPRRFDPARP